MGNFLSFSGVIGKPQADVVSSLSNYAKSVGGGLIAAARDENSNGNCCVILQAAGNTTILYPESFLEWDASSEFISRELQAAVFSLHVHDGDLWMYVLYKDGVIVDQFNPVPDYWNENISVEEMAKWKGNAFAVAKCAPFIRPEEIENYLIRWNLDEEETGKAYPADEFEQGEWQLLDFMKKLKLPYPLDDAGNPAGLLFTLWTEKLPIEPATTKPGAVVKIIKPWWKFW